MSGQNLTTGAHSPLTSEGFKPVTRKSTAPAYQTPDLSVSVPRDLVPGISDLEFPEIETDYDPQRLLAAAELPEVLPVFAAPRAWLAESRAARIQKRLEGLAQEQKQLRYIGEQVIQGKGYRSQDLKDLPEDTDRPHRLLETGPGRRLDRIQYRRMNVGRTALQIAAAHPETVGSKQTFRPFFREYDKGSDGRAQRSWGERMALGTSARKYRNNERMLRLFYDNMFKHIVTKPSRDARGLAEKRDKLTVKAEALRRHIPNKERANEMLGFDPARESAHWKILGQDVMAEDATRSLQAAVRKHGEIAILKSADEYCVEYLANVYRLGMDPQTQWISRQQMLRLLAAEVATQRGRLASVDPFIDGSSHEGYASRVNVADRLIGLRFIASAFRQVNDTFETNDAFLGSLSIAVRDETMDLALNCFTKFQASQPVSIGDLARIGRELREDTELYL